MAENDLVSGGHGRAAKLGACVNWVDWLRTSADKRMWSGRRAVGTTVGCGCSALIRRSSLRAIGLLTTRVSPSGFQQTGRRTEHLGVKLVFPRSRCRAIISDMLCMRSYVYTCVYICVCVYVWRHDICIYMHVCMYLYIYAFIHMCMCMCIHICA